MSQGINQKSVQAYMAWVTSALNQGLGEGYTPEFVEQLGEIKVTLIERLKIEFTSSDVSMSADGMCVGADNAARHFHVMQNSTETDAVVDHLIGRDS